MGRACLRLCLTPRASHDRDLLMAYRGYSECSTDIEGITSHCYWNEIGCPTSGSPSPLACHIDVLACARLVETHTSTMTFAHGRTVSK